MVLSRRLGCTRSLGKFPLEVVLNDRFSTPESAEVICSALEDGLPLYFSGQRSPLFDLGDGIFLKAKGFAYRKINYDSWVRDELKHSSPQEFGEAKPLEVRRRSLQRPIPQRYYGISAHHMSEHVDEDGKIYRKLSQARPYGAMVLEKAKQENAISERISSTIESLTDIPVGFFRFEEFPFEARGEVVPCGGCLSISRTPYDIRALEFLAYADNPQLRKELGLKKLDFVDLAIRIGYFMGAALRKMHDMRITHSYPHPENFKVIPKSEHRLAVIDLDNASLNENGQQFLGRAVLDLRELLGHANAFMFQKARYFVPQPDCPDFGVHRRYKRILEEVHEKIKTLKRDNGDPLDDIMFRSAQMGYFGKIMNDVTPARIVETMRLWRKSKKPIGRVKDGFVKVVRQAHDI